MPDYSTSLPPTVFDGLTLGQALKVLGFDYKVASIVKQPAQYKGKLFTQRGRLWRLRHWATVDHVLTLTPVASEGQL